MLREYIRISIDIIVSFCFCFPFQYHFKHVVPMFFPWFSDVFHGFPRNYSFMHFRHGMAHGGSPHLIIKCAMELNLNEIPEMMFGIGDSKLVDYDHRHCTVFFETAQHGLLSKHKTVRSYIRESNTVHTFSQRPGTWPTSMAKSSQQRQQTWR